MSEQNGPLEEKVEEKVEELPGPDSGPPPGSLLDPESSLAIEAADRERPIPGGEPDCPRCGTKMTRRVERHPAPRGGTSPFRVRLVCPGEACGAWSVYDW